MKLQSPTNEISERDASGQVVSVSVRKDKKIKNQAQPLPHVQRSDNFTDDDTRPHPARTRYQDAALDFLKRVFLPKGYPDSVPPDYTRYQIYNALQAFCNSLAGLIASRAVLEGQGIGDASASATDALLLNVTLDVFGRMTTIISAHLLGTSLVPDAKRYRLLADILNDSALALDTISPLFNAYGLPGLRIAALCLSASFRALCGIVAGGSKAAISMHFATPLSGKGDIGDLNAKDSSKETVLALFGMLLGTLIVPRLTTPFATYTALFFLIGMHIALNYLGVQSLVLRTMNHERLWISWFFYNETEQKPNFTPELVNSLERIFPITELFRLPIPIPGLPRTVFFVNPFKTEALSTFRNPLTQEVIGHVTLGSSLSRILEQPLHPDMIAEFQRWTDFVLWFDKRCLIYPAKPDSRNDDDLSEPTISRSIPPHIHVCFKATSTPGSRVQAWLAAGLLCKSIAEIHASSPTAKIGAYSLFLKKQAYHADGRWGVVEEVERTNAGKLGWDVSLDEIEKMKNAESHDRRRGDGENGEKEDGGEGEVEEMDYGAELGITVPEPDTFVVGLGYSYESKKMEVYSKDFLSAPSYLESISTPPPLKNERGWGPMGRDHFGTPYCVVWMDSDTPAGRSREGRPPPPERHFRVHQSKKTIDYIYLSPGNGPVDRVHLFEYLPFRSAISTPARSMLSSLTPTGRAMNVERFSKDDSEQGSLTLRRIFMKSWSAKMAPTTL
ncbi:hypothetical protein NMY22_g17374 [Coprinellus aureogranulatus]|nr:hypothetical protein NMY22_g17374 [Coprinellus aureogranulatus]